MGERLRWPQRKIASIGFAARDLGSIPSQASSGIGLWLSSRLVAPVGGLLYRDQLALRMGAPQRVGVRAGINLLLLVRGFLPAWRRRPVSGCVAFSSAQSLQSVKGKKEKRPASRILPRAEQA